MTVKSTRSTVAKMSKNSVMKWVDLLILKIENQEILIKGYENEILKLKCLISKTHTCNNNKEKTLIKERNNQAEESISLHSKLIKLTKSMIEEDIRTKVCLTKLAVIEKHISSRISEYPLEYEYETETIKNVRCNIVLRIKPQIGKLENEFYISLAVPTDCVRILPKIEFYCFAELYIKQNGKYYTRKDFGLEVMDRDDHEDQVFRIKNIQELNQIFQKFDSWYGSGLD